MARFPEAPVDFISEMYLKQAWRSIMPDLRANPITITSGRANEASTFAPTKSTFVLGNKDGDYSPRNPTGPWFGSLKRNTPLRQRIRNDHDEFDRTAVNSWGTSTGGNAWSINGTAANFSVSGGEGTHVVPVSNTYRETYLTNGSYRNVITSCTVELPGITDITGGDVEPVNLTLRRTSATDYSMLRVVINPAEEVSLALMHYDNTVYLSETTVFTGWAGERLRVACLIEGHKMFAKLWLPDVEPEPYGWHVDGAIDTDAPPGSGTVGIRSGVAAGNSNSKPISFVYTDWEVATPIACTEATKFQPKRDKSTLNRTVPIDANGITRRLGQSKAALRSTLYRGITTQPSRPVAYWPCEDLKNSQSIAPGFAGDIPMRVQGTPAYATYNDFDCTSPIPELRKSSWTGDIVPYVATGDIQLQYLIRVPDGGTVDNEIIARLWTNGTACQWEVKYNTGFGGLLSVQAYNTVGAQILDTGTVDFDVDGKNQRFALSLEQNGSAIDWGFATLTVGQTVGTTWNGTLASNTVGAARQVVINPLRNMDAVALGQIEVYSEIRSLFSLHLELNAYVGESSGTRIQRLCDEQRIPLVHIGDLDLTTRMGPQLPDTFLNLVKECEAADGGILFEPAGVLGLGYRTRLTMYNQAPILQTRYGTLSESWEPIEDDQLIRNDVTAQRKNGSSARSVQLTGPLSVLPVEEGGVGLYDVAPTFNVHTDDLLPDLAGWGRHLGTVDEPRYPVLVANLASRGFAASQLLHDQVLALGHGDRIVVTDPPEGESPDDISQLVFGITRRIAKWDYRVSLNCAPESPWQVLVLDSPLARVAPDDSALEDNETAGDTSLDITSVGPLWTTSGGDMPIPVTTGGERVSFTAISGAASPQTATAVRGLNVSKPQDAGEPVTLTYPPILAR